MAVELSLDESLNLGEVVEPVDEGFGDGAVIQALIDFFADGLGQPGDFTVASGIAHGCDWV
ncbi:MAG: hypothetical protein ABJF10_08875 [Chthoniobacter sp.]|uniref:hypothetical protein n=1 Tax=Chthoniobacter sp. TaxID=2510640 RepID=UPI0032A6F806